MTPVDSSNIAAVGYDQATGALTVQFKNGTTYRYANVEPHHHPAMCSAESAGRYFHEHIKSGGYKGTKVE